MRISVSCPHCRVFQEQTILWPDPSAFCLSCSWELVSHATDAFRNERNLDQCPFCGGAHLYRRKDFNQKLGIFLVVLGVLLAYFTYGLSLLAVTLVDFFLFRKVKELGVCYQCNAQFRDSRLVETLEPFDLELSDYYRNLKKRD